ncbi:hypothetical protein [Salinimicrobium soli]|uniref:hypothetical protein n=1 Tax=Salinimicrobium soli TaxID=1254399 RepID=UPI003AAC70D1
MKDIKYLLDRIEEGDETKILEEKDLPAKLNELLKHDLISLAGDKLKLSEKGKQLKGKDIAFLFPNPEEKLDIPTDHSSLIFTPNNHIPMKKRIARAYARLSIQEKSMLMISILILSFVTYILTLEA